MDELAAVLATLGPEIDDPVCAFDDVEVVFNDHHRVPLKEQGVKGVQEFGHIVYMQSSGGLIEHEECVSLSVATRQESGQLDALRFSTTQGVGTLPKRDVAQAHFVERLQLGHEPP